eukprot:5251133-Amphidinium_carterae.1
MPLRGMSLIIPEKKVKELLGLLDGLLEKSVIANVELRGRSRGMFRKALLTLNLPTDLATKAWVKSASEKGWQNTGLRGEKGVKDLSQDGVNSVA